MDNRGGFDSGAVTGQKADMPSGRRPAGFKLDVSQGRSNCHVLIHIGGRIGELVSWAHHAVLAAAVEGGRCGGVQRQLVRAAAVRRQLPGLAAAVLPQVAHPHLRQVHTVTSALKTPC